MNDVLYYLGSTGIIEEKQSVLFDGVMLRHFRV